VYKPKSLLAILVTSLVLAVVVFTVPARAATVAPDPQARAAKLAETAASVHERIDRLTSHASAAHRGTLMRRRVVRTDWRAIHVTRAVNGLNRLVLSMDAVDGGTYLALRGLNAQVVHLDRDARRLSRTALPKYGRSMCARISALADQLRVLDGSVKDRVEEPPRPPQPPDPSLPTPTPTPTATPTPTPTPYVVPTPTPTPTGIPAGAFNVMDYGAHADGVTDDSSYVQAAVDAAHAAGGGTVYMPAGTYFFHRKVTLGGDTVDVDGKNLTGLGLMQVNVNVKSGVHIAGAGPGETFVTIDQNACACFGAYNQTNVGVSALDLSSTLADNISGGCKFMYCSQILIDDIVTHDVRTGVSLPGIRDTVIRDCIAYVPSRSGLGVGFVVEACNDEGPHLEETDNVSLINCEAIGPGDETATGFRIHGWVPGGQTNSARINNVSLTDCYAHDIGTSFRLLYASNLTLLRCNAVGLATPTYKSNICLVNVDTAHLTDCTADYESLEGDDWWAMYGSADCANITED